METNNIKLNYDDVTIVPEAITTIKSRKECDCYDEKGMLPIFASCMSSVVSIDNYRTFVGNRIYPVIPRSYDEEKRLNILRFSTYNDRTFVAFSLEESKRLFFEKRVYLPHGAQICIDLANGHMQELLDVVKLIKESYEDIIIMTGNISNPETYKYYEEAGVDYVRCTIGTGNCCTTASNTGVHYPPFSLIKEIYEIKQRINGKCKVIADGGIKGFRDVQKALLYADYVMIGSLFNKAMESAGKTTYGKSYWNVRGYKILRPITTLFTYGKEIPREKFDEAFKNFKEGKLTIWKQNFGMSTKIAQSLINEANGKHSGRLKTAEGVVKYQKVEYNLAGWTENETDYLRSAMSYTNSRTLEEFKNSQWVEITQIRYNN